MTRGIVRGIVPVVIRGKPRRVRQAVEWRGVVWVTLEPQREREQKPGA